MLTGKQKRQIETSIYMNKMDKIDNVLSQLIYKTTKTAPKYSLWGSFLYYEIVYLICSASK